METSSRTSAAVPAQPAYEVLSVPDLGTLRSRLAAAAAGLLRQAASGQSGRLLPSAWAAVLAALCAGPALAAGFTGPTAPGNFTVANVGTLTGGSPVLGTAVFSASQLVMAGSNSISPAPASYAPGCAGGVYGTLASPCQLQVTLATPGVYSFNWSYVTGDADGPAGDIFGVIVDGTRIALSDPGGAVAQLGSATFTARSSFGWFVNCTDCIGGYASATVSSFVMTAVPEPATWLLGLGGAAGLALASRRTASRRLCAGPGAAR